jgi:hypothetical protein
VSYGLVCCCKYVPHRILPLARENSQYLLSSDLLPAVSWHMLHYAKRSRLLKGYKGWDGVTNVAKLIYELLSILLCVQSTLHVDVGFFVGIVLSLQ